MKCSECKHDFDNMLSIEIHRLWEHGIASEHYKKKDMIAELVLIEDKAKKLRRQVRKSF